MVACAVVAAGATLLTTGHATTEVAAASPAPAHARARVRALSVVSTTPGSGASAVAPDATVSITFSAPVAATVLPTLTPSVPGSWSQPAADTMVFTPAGSLPPGRSEQLTIPGGAQGVSAMTGAALPAPVTTTFTVAPMSLLRVQQLLAQLGYLPLTFTPQSPSPVSPPQLALDQPGAFAWRWSTLPAALTSQWVAGQGGPITKGAVMAFEQASGLTTDGIAGPQVWGALLAAVTRGANDPNANYDWVDVSTTLPESVTVWRNGAAVYQTPANTGVTGATTQPGTFPVYLRYRTTTMRGTNPNGTTYDDHGIPWVSYFNGGDALHGFVRASYGFPQSNGCVEMPPANAAVVWPMTPIGTLVTIQ